MSTASSPAPSTFGASLLPFVSSVRVSSVLNGAVAEYGKQHLLDGSSDTCWNSEQGSPQFVQLTFQQPVHIASLSVTFQGGFVGQPMEVSVVRSGSRRFEPCAVYETADHNAPQQFPFLPPQQPPSQLVAAADSGGSGSGSGSGVVALRLHFPASSDLYGRVTVYHIDVTGAVHDAAAAH